MEHPVPERRSWTALCISELGFPHKSDGMLLPVGSNGGTDAVFLSQVFLTNWSAQVGNKDWTERTGTFLEVHRG